MSPPPPRGELPRRTAALVALLLALPQARAADPPPGQPLESITVLGTRIEVENLIDRKVYHIEADLQSSFGSLTDVLSNLPSVDVDPDGNVALRGDTNVLILIDGKPAPQFTGAAAGDALQAFPASEIERIEVITNPPPEFKAEGTAGILNIITRKHRPHGFAGTLQGSLGSGGRSLLGTSASYAASAWTLALTAAYRADFRRRSLMSVVTAAPSSAEAVTTTNTIEERYNRNIVPLTLSAGYAFNSRQRLSIDLARNARHGLRDYIEFTDSRGVPGGLLAAAERLSAGHDSETDGDAKLAFRQQLAREGEALDLTVHRAVSHEHERYDYSNFPLTPPAAPFEDNLAFHEDHGTSEASADYVRPLPGRRTLKLGYDLERQDFQYGAGGANLDAASGLELTNPLLSDDFRFTRRTHAAYASYQLDSGRWTWLLGGRGELTRTDGRQVTTGMRTHQRYRQFFPSLHLTRALADASTLSLAATRRVTYPDPSQLNPYIDYEYTPNLSAGNAALRPQYTQSYELGYGYEGPRARSYSLTAYLRRNADSFTQLVAELGNGVTLSTQTNLPRNDAAGAEFSAAGHVLPRLTYVLSGNLFHSQIDATALGTPGLRTTTGLNLKAKLDYRSGPDSAQLTLSRTARRLTPQGEIAPITVVNVGYRRRLSDSLNAVATAADLFSGQRYERTLLTPALSGFYRRSVHGGVVWVGLIYRLGGSAKEKDKGPAFEYDEAP
ncbi:MAG: TonB-dependent receptor [Gammaproteobacteria bacterium]|nr:TonB-dependent receptor [Gammaproteobacteria bacterium]